MSMPHVDLLASSVVPTACDPKSITISRQQEINALRVGQELANDPGLANRWKELVALPAVDFERMSPSLDLEEFAPGWVIVGQKPGGIEGGCIIRRTWAQTDESFEPGSGAHAAVADLHTKGQLGKFQHATIEESLEALRDADRSNPEFREIYGEIRYHDEFNKSFMVKILFGENDIQGDMYYCPNARNAVHRQWTARTGAELHQATLEEYFSLIVAKALSNEIVPEARRGQVDGRPILLTEMGGSGTAGKVSIKTADRVDQQIDWQNFNKEAFKLAYAIIVGMLNDWDANADPNVGIVETDGQARQPFLFDLGHAAPREMTMDAETLMPTCRANGLEASSFWQSILRIVSLLISYFRFEPGRFFANPDFMTVGDRADALQNLIDRQNDIWQAIEGLEHQFADDEAALRMVHEMRNMLDARITYMGRVLNERRTLMLEPGAAPD
jgi:hypothetical protein